MAASSSGSPPATAEAAAWRSAKPCARAAASRASSRVSGRPNSAVGACCVAPGSQLWSSTAAPACRRLWPSRSRVARTSICAQALQRPRAVVDEIAVERDNVRDGLSNEYAEGHVERTLSTALDEHKQPISAHPSGDLVEGLHSGHWLAGELDAAVDVPVAVVCGVRR